MSFTICSDDALVLSNFCLTFASPCSYDEPEILLRSNRQFCRTSVDGRQFTRNILGIALALLSMIIIRLKNTYRGTRRLLEYDREPADDTATGLALPWGHLST